MLKIGDKVKIKKRKIRHLIRDMHVYLKPLSREFTIEYAKEVFSILGAHLNKDEPLQGKVIAYGAKEGTTRYLIVNVKNSYGTIDNIAIEETCLDKIGSQGNNRGRPIKRRF